MGYYLDIHSGDNTQGQVTPEKMRELLLRDGAGEEEDGPIWFAGGMGHVVTEGDRRRQQQRQRDAERVDGILTAIGMPTAPEVKSPTVEELADFRFSWGTGAGQIAESIRKLLEFCRRHGFRLYDGQAERYIDEDTVEVAIASLARGRAWVEQLLPSCGHPIGGAASHGMTRKPRSDQGRCPTSLQGPGMPAAELDTPVEDIGLSVRARKALERLKIRTVRELSNQTAESLLTCKNFGRTSLKEIENALAALGVRLRPSEASADGVSGADTI